MAKTKKKTEEEAKTEELAELEAEMIALAMDTVAEYEDAYDDTYRDMYFLRETEVAAKVVGKPDLPVVRDPRPHDSVNLAVDILSVLEPTIKVVVGEPEPEKKKKAWKKKQEEKTLRLTKILRAILQMSDRFQEGTLREIALRHGLLDGRMVTKILDIRDQGYYQDGSFPLMIQALDPFTVYPIRGVVGYDGFVERKMWRKAQLKRMWPEFPAWKDKKFEEAELLYFWEVWTFTHKWYGISATLDEEPETVDGPREHGWTRPPYAYRMIRHVATEEHSLEALSFLFGYEDVGKFINYIRTHITHAIPKYLNQAYATFTQEGKSKKLALDAGAVTPFKKGEDVKPLIRGEIPKDVFAMLSMLIGDADRTLLPSSLTGEPIGGQVAGYLMSQYIASGKSRLNSWLTGIEMLLADTLTIAAEQIRAGPGPVLLYYYGPKGTESWFEEVEADEIPERFMVNVKVHPYFEQEKLQKMTWARMARARGVHGWPLLDDELIREELMEMGEDVEVKERLVKEAAGSMQVIGPILARLVQEKVAEKLGLPPARPQEPTAMQGEQWMSNLPPELQQAMGGMGGVGAGMMPGPGEMPPEQMGMEGMQGMGGMDQQQMMQIVQMLYQMMRGGQPL